MGKIDIEKIANKMGFNIYFKLTHTDDNIIGYIDCNGDKSIIVSAKEKYELESEYYYKVRYIISLAVSYYEEAENKDKYQKIIYSNIHDFDIEQKAILKLLPEKNFKKAYNKYKNDIDKLSQKFEVPSWIIEKRINENNHKKLTKSNL